MQVRYLLAWLPLKNGSQPIGLGTFKEWFSTYCKLFPENTKLLSHVGRRRPLQESKLVSYVLVGLNDNVYYDALFTYVIVSVVSVLVNV